MRVTALFSMSTIGSDFALIRGRAAYPNQDPMRSD